MFRVPQKLVKYIDYDNGKMVISKDAPNELKEDLKEVEMEYNSIQKKGEKGDLSEY